MPRSPLPQRFGLDAARIRTPQQDGWATLREHLHERLTRVDNERIDEMFAAGRYVDDAGVPLTLATRYTQDTVIWFHRDLPDEPEVPFRVEVLHTDDRIVVVDKPHFLATIPRGQHILQTVLVRVRSELALPELAPAHRLDRATAGVLMLTTRPEWRGAYQNLFRDRLAHKTYLAVAPYRSDLELPTTVRSHIVK
ncbi:MAG: pseudouridine synthase, partial [Nakamurella sp.]